MEEYDLKTKFFRRQIALPQDHGSWVFLISPLLIGLFAGGNFNLSSLFLIIGAFSLFLIRQPLTMAIKVYSKRRPRRDLPAIWFWSCVYAVIGLGAIIGLVVAGYSYLLLLAIPGIPVFAWHLFLVSRRAERRQVGVEIVATGVLALTAPAAFWVGIGKPDPLGWWLFVLCWLQSAASIVYAYLRLAQRDLADIPPIKRRFRLGSRALLYTTFNLGIVSAFSLAGKLPVFLPVPYLLQWTETLWGITHPAIGQKPTRIGIRQLIVSVLFTILFIVTWE